ncbi:ankyrin repeat-containing domain protein [Aspergillus venezuelensis]
MARYQGFVDGDYSDLALLQAVAKAAKFRHADAVKLLMQRIESSASLHYRYPGAVLEVFRHSDHETVQALLTRCSPNKLGYWKPALLQAAEHYSVQILSTVLTDIKTPLSVSTIHTVLGQIKRSGCLHKLSFMLRRLGPAEAMPSEFWKPEASPLEIETHNQPTYIALRNGRLSTLKALLRWAPRYAHLNTKQGETLLSCAILYNQPEILRYLLSLGLYPTTPVVLSDITYDFESDINQSLPLYACREGYTEILELLLAHGCDVNSRDYIFSLNHRRHNPMLGATLLSWASHQGHIDCVRLLLAKGADIHAASETRYTALCCAARKQH